MAYLRCIADAHQLAALRLILIGLIMVLLLIFKPQRFTRGYRFIRNR